MNVRQFILLSVLSTGLLLAAACGEEQKPPLVIGSGASDADTDSDSDSDADPDAGYVGKTCDPATAATDCGANLYCVDSVCCKDQCTGECGSCAVPGFEGHCTALDAGTVCRAAATACDEEESCDGSAKICPPDETKSIGAACGDDVDNDCDNPDTCDINGICQPNYAPAGGACTDRSGFCKWSPTCNGEGLCTSDSNKEDGTACGDPTQTECDLPDACQNGVCEYRFRRAGAPCGDQETNTECDAADMCDGWGSCNPLLADAGTPCGDATEDECNEADQCDGAGICDPRWMPDETACGDATNGDCNKPDSCLSGVCASNIIPDGTICNDGESTVVFRCSDTDCSATPQQQVVGWSCTAGECAEVVSPEWEDLGLPCTASQVCTVTESSAACKECDEQQPNVCVDKVATGFYPEGFCSIADGAAQCVYDAMEEDCSKDTEGNINCVNGACTSYTCEPGEKDKSFSFDVSDEGWDLGMWAIASGWPWQQNPENPYLRLVTPESDPLAEADTYLTSPEMGLFACTSGTVSFYITFEDQYDSCAPLTYIALECGAGDDWTELWTEVEVAGTHTGPVVSKASALVEDVDISLCLERTEMYFRFSLKNLCSKRSISMVYVDEFTVTAVQDATIDTTPVDTATAPVDTATTPVDTATAPVDTATAQPQDTADTDSTT
ncbi:MAG: hypothetical protein JXX14_09160 [Deltaproteobacteria bacterium]|nr:hypothetical protein [Deltaproteobacteria bacterium]